MKAIGQITEKEWLSVKTTLWILPFTEHHTKASNRKSRLFACACCRRIWHLLAERWRQVVEQMERYSDGMATKEQVGKVVAAAGVPRYQQDMASFSADQAA